MNHKKDRSNLMERINMIAIFFSLGWISIQNLLDKIIIHFNILNQSNDQLFSAIMTFSFLFLALINTGSWVYLAYQNELSDQHDSFNQSIENFTNVIIRTKKNNQDGYLSFMLDTDDIQLFFVLLAKIKQESQTKRDYHLSIKKLIAYFEKNVPRLKRSNSLSPTENFNNSLIVIDDNHKKVFYLDNCIKKSLFHLTNNEINNVFAYKKGWFKKMGIFLKYTANNPVMPWQALPDWVFYHYNPNRASGYLKMVFDLVKNGFELNEQEMIQWHIACKRKIEQNSQILPNFSIVIPSEMINSQNKALNKIESFLSDFESLKSYVEFRELKKIKSNKQTKQHVIL